MPNLEPVVEQSFSNYAYEMHYSVNLIIERLQWTLENVCESPMERLLLINLMSQIWRAFSCSIWISDPTSVLEGKPSFIGIQIDYPLSETNFRLMIYPQSKILIDKSITLSPKKVNYRVDFLIQLDEESAKRPDIFVQYIVEVDGHVFHERTKEQARRDRQRDRYLTASGYKIFRFTGSEVYQDEMERQKMLQEDLYIYSKPYIIEQLVYLIEKDLNSYIASR